MPKKERLECNTYGDFCNTTRRSIRPLPNCTNKTICSEKDFTEEYLLEEKKHQPIIPKEIATENCQSKSSEIANIFVINSVKKDCFLRTLLEDFTLKQNFILDILKNDIINKLTFYSANGRSGTGLKHGYPPFRDFISLRNLAILLGVNKGNLISSMNHFLVLVRIEDSLNTYNLAAKGQFTRSLKAFSDFISDFELDYLIFRVFLKYSSSDFSPTRLCELLGLSDDGISIFKSNNYNIIFNRLLNIFFLGEEVFNLGINPTSLDSLQRNCYNTCIDYLLSKHLIFRKEPGVDNFNLVFHTLLTLNRQNGKRKSSNSKFSLGDLSSMLSLGEINSSKRSYLYGILYRCSRIGWKILNNLLRLCENYDDNNLYKEVKNYLLKYHWRQLRSNDKGYHKYWDRKELKTTLRKFLIDETLGLDINCFKFIELDKGDIIEIHHIFGNRESILLRDLISLLTFSHKSFTFSSLNKTEVSIKILNNILSKRKSILSRLSKLSYSKENESKIRSQFSNPIWDEMEFEIKQEWISRWREKSTLNEQEWYEKYSFADLFREYTQNLNLLKERFLSRNLKSKFIFWYFQCFLSTVFID